MKVILTEKERAELLKIWRSGVMDLEKLPSLKPYLARKRMTNEEARAIIEKLNL